MRLKLYHLIVIVTLFVLVFSTASSASRSDGLLHVYFLDIGQGDAIFIESPTGNQILIDGGPDGSVVNRLAEVMPPYDHDLDAVLVSHPHADHIGGLIEVFGRYQVDSVIQAYESYRSPQFDAWVGAVEDERAKNTEAIAGAVLDLGGGAKLTILHPFSSADGLATETPHDQVVTALLEYKRLKILFTGDMEASVERKLVERYGSLVDADVLKVGHHGSKTSTTEDFLRVVSPQLGIIQVGAKNRYGHPAPVVLERLETFGIKYYRTDMDGTVGLVSDGLLFSISKTN